MRLDKFIAKYGNYEIKDEEKLLKLLYKNEKWMPNRNEYYYMVDFPYDSVMRYLWYNGIYDIYYYKHNNCFQTEAEAKKCLEIHRTFEEASFEPNWYDCDQNKYFFSISYADNFQKIDINSTNYFRFHNQYYFPSREIAQSLLNKFGQKDIAKYIFGVEI